MILAAVRVLNWNDSLFVLLNAANVGLLRSLLGACHGAIYKCTR